MFRRVRERNNARSMRSSAAIAGPAHFRSQLESLRAGAFLKVNGKLVGKEQAGIIPHEPGDSIQIGADLVQRAGRETTRRRTTSPASSRTSRSSTQTELAADAKAYTDSLESSEAK